MNGIETAFSGRVGLPPTEVKTSASGKTWCYFTVAVNVGEEEGQWLKVSAFGDRAAELVGTLLKGDRVYVEGRLRMSHWTDKEGAPRTGLEVAAWRVDRQGEIGRNKPDAKATTLRKRESGKRAWQAPADEVIPF